MSGEAAGKGVASCSVALEYYISSTPVLRRL
jgi:hypothetical protein